MWWQIVSRRERERRMENHPSELFRRRIWSNNPTIPEEEMTVCALVSYSCWCNPHCHHRYACTRRHSLTHFCLHHTLTRYRWNQQWIWYWQLGWYSVDHWDGESSRCHYCSELPLWHNSQCTVTGAGISAGGGCSYGKSYHSVSHIRAIIAGLGWSEYQWADEADVKDEEDWHGKLQTTYNEKITVDERRLRKLSDMTGSS